MSELRIRSASILSSVSHLTGKIGKESYRSRRAAERGDKVSLTLTVPRRVGARKLCLTVYNETVGTSTEFPMVWSGFSGCEERYTVLIDSTVLKVGLCFLSFSCETAIGSVYSEKLSHDTLVWRESAPKKSEGFQLLVSEFAYPAPKRYCGGIIYQIFVDRFRRGRKTPIPEEMRFNSDWNSGELEYPAYPGAPMKNNTVWGGNLDGIRESLDYLASLGVTLLYLTPIFKSPSNHKYDTADYLSIDPMFGTEKDLSELISEAKARGIGILLDGVFNHTGADSIYFNREGHYPSIGAAAGKSSPYYEWYRFGEEYPVGYECWWNIDILPRIHTEVPSCAEFFIGSGGVIEKYASLGIAGMRLDVADELSDGFIAAIKSRLAAANGESLLYGEVWEDASNKIAYDKRKCYYHGKELDGVMNYPLRKAILSYLKDGATDAMRYYFDEVMPNMPRRILHTQMNLLGTHDTARAITELAGQSPEGKTNAELLRLRMSGENYAIGQSRLVAAWAILSTLPGLPMIYYGDEVGMQGYADPFNRRTFPWGNEDSVLLAAYREIGAWRREHRAYAEGNFRLWLLDRGHLIFERYVEGERLLTVFNRSKTSFEMSVTCKNRYIFKGRTKKGRLVLEAGGIALLQLSS